MDSHEQTFDQAVQLHEAGRLGEAEKLYRQLLAADPEDVDVLHFLGVIAIQRGQTEAAVDFIRRALAVDPDFPEAHNNLGAALKAQHHFAEATAAHRRAIALKPDYAEAHNNLGIALKESGQLDAAIVAFRQAIALRPDLPEPYNNLAAALKSSNRFAEAVAAFRRAIALNPNLAEAHNNLGLALIATGQLDQAAAAFREAIHLRPDYAEAHSNLGIALREQDQLDASIAAYRQAISLQPNLADTHNGLANALKDAGQLDAAVAAYRRAIALKPGFAEAHSNLILALHYHPAATPRDIAEELHRFNAKHTEPLRKFITPHPNDRSSDRPLRIGYVSADLREHVVGRNLLPLLRHHDRRQFEIFCYANVNRPDTITAQLQQFATHWRPIAALPDAQVAEQIRADQIDILVDLAQHTAHNRLLLFARKPAPVQVSYLGYAGSTGVSAIDYRLSDPDLDPPDIISPIAEPAGDAEKILRLPRTFWCYQPRESPDPAPAPSLANGFITFGCLNNFAKISPAALDLWAKILLAVPDSRLLLHAPSGSPAESTAHHLQQAGIARERLTLIPRQSWLAYAQTYSQIDIALDPFPYGGGITSCDALWMGVPFITLSGPTPVSRAGRSILSKLNLADLIADTPDDYIRIATTLAHDHARLAMLHQTLRAKMLASPLMDAAGFAAEIEAAYRQMWLTWLRDEAPL